MRVRPIGTADSRGISQAASRSRKECARAPSWPGGSIPPNDVSQRLALFGASLWWNPNPTAPWYLKGGIGLLQYHAATDNENDVPLTGSAAALQLGGGYDIRAARKLWFTPFANLIVSSSGNLTSGNTIVTDASYSMLQLGAGLTWR